MGLKTKQHKDQARPWGYSLVEVLIAACVLGLLTLALFAALAFGLGIVHASRDNLRATQILTQKMETIRLLTWKQLTNNVIAPTNFVSYYDPGGSNAGTIYLGRYSTRSTPSGLPPAYADKMRLVNVDLYWTNRSSPTKAIVQRRQVQTFVARYGLQPYVYQ